MKARTLSLAAATACAVLLSTAAAQSASADEIIDWSYDGYYDEDTGDDWFYDTYGTDSTLATDYGYTSDSWGYDYYDGFYDDDWGDDWYYDTYDVL